MTAPLGSWLLRRGVRCAAALLTVLCLVLAGQGRPADPPPMDDKSKLVEMKKVELNQLPNKDLLEQSGALHEKTSWDYLAQLRALAAAEVLLDEVRRQTDEVKIPAPPTPTPGATEASEEAARMALDAAKARQEAVQRKLKLVQTQKALLDRITAGIEGCRTANVAFQNALDTLKMFALESGLRVKDGSLPKEMLPDRLQPEFLQKKKQELLDDLDRLKTKSADVQKGQEAIVKLLEETNKTALTADADSIEASRNLVREQKRQELEKAYAGKKPSQMIAELTRMVDEGDGLKGTYELALRKFDSRTRTAARLRKELDEIMQPEVMVPQLTRAEDVETAAKSIQELIGFYASRSKKIEELRGALTALAREGGEFEADAAVSEEHLFKMQVLANLLKKNGTADEKLPAKGRPATLGPAAARQKESAAAVRAATEKAKAELTVLERQRSEARAAGEAASKQLATLKESQEVTLAALKWEGQLAAMTGPQILEAFTTIRKELTDRQEKLKGEADNYTKAAAAVAEAKARLDGLKDPFLRTAEEQGQPEKQKILGELRKEAGLERPMMMDPMKVAAPPMEEPKKAEPAKKPEADTRSDLEKASDHLFAFQQLLSGRVRVLDEREAKRKELLASFDELEKQAAAYSKTLADARLLALRLNATAVDLKKRVGKGDLSSDAIPEGITDALRLELRTKLDGSATAVLNGLTQLQQDREKLQRPDPEGEALTTATRELLTVVGKRLDLLADRKRLAADYSRDKSARPPSEVKRLEQLASDRLSAESSAWDTFLGIDSSKTAKNLSELLESYYRELIEIEEKEENLTRQREKMEQLVELTQQETAAVNRVLPMLDRQLAQLVAAREEESVLARARLRPDRADELLEAYQTRTGRLLTKPMPIGEQDKDRAAKVEELATLLFDRYVALEAAKRWEDMMNGRLAATGVKAEAGVYQDELSKISADSAANVRRIHTLTGRETSASGEEPPTKGEIAKTHDELTRVRTHGVKRIGLLIGAILLGAILLPRLLMWGLRRALGGTGNDDSSLVLSALRAIVKVAVWVVAVAMILSVLGFNVTAIVAGLGIGGLAIGLAAQPMIADVIGAIVIFAEGRFKIGDVIRVGGDEPGRVVGLTWRSTQVRNADGLVVTIPNRKVTEATIQNLTRAGGTFDSLNVSVITQADATRVLGAIKQALNECPQLGTDHGVSMKELNQKGETRTIKYRFWWFLADYETRNKTREEVFARISANLAGEDLAGTEISLA
jgi:small-conductance mechanosensitive channel